MRREEQTDGTSETKQAVVTVCKENIRVTWVRGSCFISFSSHPKSLKLPELQVSFKTNELVSVCKPKINFSVCLAPYPTLYSSLRTNCYCDS